MTPLMLSLEFVNPFDPSITESLIKNPTIDLNQKDDDGQTALIYAVRKDQTQVVQDLINAGARTDIKDNRWNYDALDYANSMKNTKLIDILKKAQK